MLLNSRRRLLIPIAFFHHLRCDMNMYPLRRKYYSFRYPTGNWLSFSWSNSLACLVVLIYPTCIYISSSQLYSQCVIITTARSNRSKVPFRANQSQQLCGCLMNCKEQRTSATLLKNAKPSLHLIRVLYID